MLRGSFQPDALTGERYFRWRGGDVSRLEGLCDAVFALALTLLVVRLDVPKSFDEVRYAILHAPVYLACFAVAVWIWYCHYQFHRRYGLEGPLAVTLDAAVLFIVLLFALPLRFVAELMFSRIANGGKALQRGPDGEPLVGPDGESLWMLSQGDERFLLATYGGGFALVFLLLLVQTWMAYAKADALELDQMERLVTRNTMRAHFASFLIGALSLGFAVVGGSVLGPAAGLVFFALGPVHGVLGYIGGRSVVRLARDQQDAT